MLRQAAAFDQDSAERLSTKRLYCYLLPRKSTKHLCSDSEGLCMKGILILNVGDLSIPANAFLYSLNQDKQSCLQLMQSS